MSRSRKWESCLQQKKSRRKSSGAVFRTKKVRLILSGKRVRGKKCPRVSKRANEDEKSRELNNSLSS